MSKNKKSAARHLVDALVANGTTHVFCVPGESYLAVLDALYDVREQIKIISCRHEAAAANMAEAHGKLTGRPGICMVTRGPGATQGAVGVHTAFQDSTPMIYFIGQVARDMRDREAFQEVDYRGFFAPLAKWTAEIEVAARMPEYVNRAFSTAQSGRRGPVVLALPEDMLCDEVDVQTLPAAPVAAASPSTGDIAAFQERLSAASRPLLLAGGGGWTSAAVDELARFTDATGIPVAASFRAKDVIDNHHPNYIGDIGIGPNPQLVDRVKDCDLLIALGPRLGEMTTSGYTLMPAPKTVQDLIHIYPQAEEIGQVYWPQQGINSAPENFLKAVNALDWSVHPDWQRAAHEGHQQYLAFSTPVEVKAGVNLSEVFAELATLLPDDAIICNGAGNYAAWLHRFFRHRKFKSQLAPTSGAMGYGFPAALAAKAVAPSREVVCVAGDGCFMMASNELATAVQYGLNVIVLVSNNGTYGTIRMHQERDYPARVSGTDLVNPDFKAYAESFGAFGARVESASEFRGAFDAARKSGRPAVIELVTSAEEIAPGKTLTGLRNT